MSNATVKQTTDIQRIRGPNLAVLIPRNNGVPFEEGLARANSENKVIASNKRLSQALVGSEEWKTIREVFACWSGTMTAYAKPGEKLGKTVEYVDSETGHHWVFPVPQEHQGKADAILVAEHPDYNLEIDGKTRIVRAAQVDLIERFPAKDGWYLGDAKHDIPIGELVNGSDEARYLYRIDSRVGPVARAYNYDNYNRRRGVDLLGDRPSVGLGVAVEAPEGRKPQKMLVKTAETGVLITGVTVDGLSALLENAGANLNELSQMLKPEKLTALRQLVEALEIKE
jgi:hypothetical protein